MVRFEATSLIKARLGASLTWNVDVGPQQLTDLHVDFFSGTLQVTRVQDGLFVEGTLQSRLTLECVRCLETFTLPLTLTIEEKFRLPGSNPREDARYAVSPDGWLDLTPLLRELSWLAVPMKPLCRPDCKGICPQCGANLNVESCTCERSQIDPRLEKLKELL